MNKIRLANGRENNQVNQVPGVFGGLLDWPSRKGLPEEGT